MKINLDQLAAELGLPSWEKWSEYFDYHDTWAYVYKDAYQEAVDAGYQVAEAEEIAEKKAGDAEQEEELEHYNRYYDNLMHVAEEVFSQHGLQLVPTNDPGPNWILKDDLDGLRKKRR